MERFYLGTHQVSWLGYAGFPLFVSHRRLRMRRSLPVASSPWALDSGGFSALDSIGQWDMNEAGYVMAVRRYRDEIGMLDWAAPMDWMCEPRVRAKTGKTVSEHQRLTVNNYLRLKELAPELPFIPVLQGFTLDEYKRCADLYGDVGVDLSAELVVGLGSVCRRQASSEIAAIIATLSDRQLRLHGFGVKTRGLETYSADLVSADSMSWSSQGRRLPGCGRGHHQSEANCFEFARGYRSKLIAATYHQQLTLGGTYVQLL
jgi:hypothetical protein